MKNALDQHVRAYEGELQYDFDNEILLNWYPKRILKHTQNCKSLLELGLGHGYTTTIFSKQFSKHVVLDGSNAIIKNFQSKYPDCKAEIVETYFEKFESNEKFDLIVMGFILEHVDNPVEILKHYKQFLAPNGRMFIAVPNAEVLNRRLGHAAGLLKDMQELSENDHILGHQRYYTVQSLTDDVNAAGYSVAMMEGIYLKPLTTSQMISLNFDKKIIDAFCEVGIQYPELCCGILAEIKG
ncbi:class I SAM-dependent methyltransferase [Flavobacterium sp.]|uniref:class I SAM-dependent methyltransferase n=1 Tax=Flavobacterium sp. TaxID=239 RepID=UPI00286C86A5|nr:class I SAM-dependent methyltransferase [Flavobacterium sp.]